SCPVTMSLGDRLGRRHCRHGVENEFSKHEQPPPTPALLTRMWTLPYRATVASAAAWSSALSDTSALTPSTSALVSFNFATAVANASSSMSHNMTFTPACDSAVAIPNPMPDAAPVTKAVRPARFCMCVFPLLLQLALALGAQPSA